MIFKTLCALTAMTFSSISPKGGEELRSGRYWVNFGNYGGMYGVMDTAEGRNCVLGLPGSMVGAKHDVLVYDLGCDNRSDGYEYQTPEISGLKRPTVEPPLSSGYLDSLLEAAREEVIRKPKRSSVRKPSGLRAEYKADQRYSPRHKPSGLRKK